MGVLVAPRLIECRPAIVIADRPVQTAQRQLEPAGKVSGQSALRNSRCSGGL